MYPIDVHIQKLPASRILKELQEIIGNRTIIPFDVIYQAVKDNPGKYPRLRDDFFSHQKRWNLYLLNAFLLENGFIKYSETAWIVPEWMR